MAIRTKDISADDSMKEQLQEFVLEANTHYADSSRTAANRLLSFPITGKIVDLGCGDGAVTPFLANFEVIGVDINQKKLDLNTLATTVKDDIVGYLKKQSDNSIDNIFSHHALEHLPNPQMALDLIGKKLKPGGYVYLEVPANDHIHSVHHATFDTPDDLLPLGLEKVEVGSGHDEHYLIARKHED
jgi:SAM-dependent methyltransferase